MLSLRRATLLLSLALGFVQAAPVDTESEDTSVNLNTTFLEKRETFPVSTAQVASFRPYSIYAAVPGCGVSSILAWNCAKCSSNPQFTPVAAGGDGGAVQFWYVGYDPTLDTVIVSFQGTDAEKMYVGTIWRILVKASADYLDFIRSLPILTDADFFLTPLSSSLFPGIGSSVETHNGFALAQSLSAAPVLSAVKSAMSRFSTTHVTVVGHSLGGAIATISAVHLKVNLPSTTTFKLVTYGCPRVGNQAFADFVDSHFSGAVSRIVNKKDIVPIVPGRFLGFHHVEGELHILNDLSWVSCPGQDNTDANCSIGYVPNIFVGDADDHGGPYAGVSAMRFLRPVALLLSFAVSFVQAIPAQEKITDALVKDDLSVLEKRETIPLSAQEVASFRPYTIYAAIPVCGTASLLAWNCPKCSQIPDFVPVAAGGDGGVVQIWFVGYDPTLNSVIVSFQGTDPLKIIPLLVDVDVLLTPLNPLKFPGILSLTILTHNGFADAQALSAAPVLAAVRQTMTRFNTTNVAVVGHSLGGAIATISAVHLKLHLPSTTKFKVVTYGSPRVGNQFFANYFDAHFPGAMSRVVNRRDIAPVVPPRLIGYEHVSGQLHILDDSSWVSCPGQESLDANCSLGYVPDILDATINDHGGPYGDVAIGC
ncbi:hypothetical protein NP233_g3843 [Leucocoprinus birnbaumii]|uniref:Fungal lipase-type domain-containing protein n=1 Tax=Leucocoprinus birnbaumii TaxID=56174 RepID=A0AAD5VZP7_9AGAR|nr:hypothetical protein NP233_g3843 [Leucocoprinus birnbaumii]